MGGLTLGGVNEAPVLNDSGTMVFAASDSDNERHLFTYDLSTGTGKVLVPPGFTIGGQTLYTILEMGFNDAGALLIRGAFRDQGGGPLHEGFFELPEFFSSAGTSLIPSR